MDITEIHKKIRQLSNSEAKYKAIMEQAAEMLFLHDMDGNIVEVNRAAVERSGYTSEELLRKTVFDIDPDARVRSDKHEIWDQIIASSKQTFEARHIGKSGEIYPVEVTV
jgi:PAS domain S-box-containing protein